MKNLLITLLLFISLGLFANERGLTVSEIPVSNIISKTEVPVLNLIEVPAPISNPLPNHEEWYPVNTLDLDFRLNARQQYGMYFHGYQETALPFGSMGVLSSEGKQAVAKAPAWMQAELAAVLASLLPAKQIIWANLILDTNDPYVDEVAFSIANSSPEYLNSDYALPQLFTENAELIYSIDTALDYVQVINTGSASTGGNYYSTTSYFKKDAAGQIVPVSVPKELYYWYIVHPKLTDEIAAYIDPAVVENNSTHANNIVAPPAGKFWRDYLYTLQQDGYPVLADTLQQCQTLFNRDGTPGDAIRTIQWWINQNMSFNSNNERPHQPVRIIAKRMGRCGEYADLTTALSRLALIPCTSILSVSTDHTWNEFWEEGWVAWEPVNGYIDNPLVYENGWGKVFGSVFEIRSDGLFTPVTDRYSEGHANIVIQVVDANSVPVDGARVVLALLEGTNRYDCEQFTDNSGIVNFVVGENRNYRARVETTFAIYPEIAGTYTQLIENAVSGETYQYILELPSALPATSLQVIDAPVDTVDDHRFALSYESPGYYISSISLWDDIDVVGSLPLHYRYVDDPSTVSSMVMDADAIIFWQLEALGSACNYLAPAFSGSSSFNIPLGQNWYAFVDNSHRHRNAVKLSGSMVYERYGTANSDEVNSPAAFKLLSLYPNPFAENQAVRLQMTKDVALQAKVYNLKGQLVKSWDLPNMKKGETEISWDATDAKGSKLASGIYLLSIGDDKPLPDEESAYLQVGSEGNPAGVKLHSLGCKPQEDVRLRYITPQGWHL